MKSRHTLSSGRLIALLSVFAGIPLILLVALPLKMATDSLGHEATARVSDTGSVSANAISLQMQSLVGLAQSFSARPELLAKTTIPATSASNPAVETLTQLQASNINIRSASILDGSGKVITGIGGGKVSPGLDLSYRDYYKGAIARDAPYVGGAIITAVEPHAKIVTVSKAIHGPANSSGQQPVQGVLVMSVDVSQVFQSYVNSFKTSSSISISIVDQANGVVAAPGLDNTVPQIVDSHLADARGGNASSARLVQNNVHVIVAYTPIDKTGWVLQTSVPQKAAFAPIDQFRARVFIIALILFTVIAIALSLLVRSVRARERADDQTRNSEERLRTVIDTVRQAFCELDVDMKITDWNAQSETMLGWSREEIWGRSYIDTLVLPDRHDVDFRLIRELIEEEGAPSKRLTVSSHMLSKDGEAIPVEINMWATDVAGRRRINLFANDISERIRLEREQELVVKRQRRLVEELRTADKAKNDFISTISHELRTPLTSIVGYLEMLNDGYGGDLSSNQSSMLDVIDRNSRRLLSLIEDVLTLSRIESGAFRGRAVAVDVSTLVQGAVQTFVPGARAKSLALEVDVPREVGMIRGDQGQLERVLLNIISNAIKFTPEDGRVSVIGYKSNGVVSISVSDSGIGIPVQEQHRLFSRFFRASTAQDHAIQGTGLGLTIVKSIVERHGGSISVQSAESRGTTVILEFPSADVEAPAPAL